MTTLAPDFSSCHRALEALDLGLVVVVVDAGPDAAVGTNTKK
jgi:hypothetical protein